MGVDPEQKRIENGEEDYLVDSGEPKKVPIGWIVRG